VDGAVVTGGVDVAQGDRRRGAETPRATGGDLARIGAPDRLAGVRDAGVTRGLVVADEDVPLVVDGPRFDRAGGLEGPDRVAVNRVEGEDLVVVGAEGEVAVDRQRRGFEVGVEVSHPGLLARLPHPRRDVAVEEG